MGIVGKHFCADDFRKDQCCKFLTGCRGGAIGRKYASQADDGHGTWLPKPDQRCNFEAAAVAFAHARKEGSVVIGEIGFRCQRDLFAIVKRSNRLAFAINHKACVII